MLNIVSKDDLSIKDIIQVADYEIIQAINLNTNSFFILSDIPIANRKDFVKYNDFLGVISKIETDKKKLSCKVYVDDINSIFDRNIILTNESLIASTGLEDFIAEVIYDRFTNSGDTLLNINYLDVTVSTHTPLNITVDTQDGIYNFKSFLGLVKEKYQIELDYTFSSTTLDIVISKKTPSVYDIDLTITDIVDYDEVYSINTIAKVTVLSKETSTETNYYLKSDGSITTNSSDVLRVIGDIECVVCEKDVDVSQKAIDTFLTNSYNHNISFNLVSDSKVYENHELYVNRPLRIKTVANGVYTTYITKSKVNYKSISNYYECGNLQVTLVSKLKGVL